MRVKSIGSSAAIAALTATPVAESKTAATTIAALIVTLSAAVNGASNALNHRVRANLIQRRAMKTTAVPYTLRAALIRPLIARAMNRVMNHAKLRASDPSNVPSNVRLNAAPIRRLRALNAPRRLLRLNARVRLRIQAVNVDAGGLSIRSNGDNGQD
jgi:hypothetical protein